MVRTSALCCTVLLGCVSLGGCGQRQSDADVAAIRKMMEDDRAKKDDLDRRGAAAREQIERERKEALSKMFDSKAAEPAKK